MAAGAVESNALDEQISEMFRMMDRNGDGHLTQEEACICAEVLGVNEDAYRAAAHTQCTPHTVLLRTVHC